MAVSIPQIQGECAAQTVLGIAQDVQAGRATPERGREIAELVTSHLSDEAKAIATRIVNQQTGR